MSGWFCDKQIGCGSFGTVEKWTNRETNESVALKVPRYMGGTDAEEKRKMWLTEIDQLQAVSHPNIVGVRPLPEGVYDVHRHLDLETPILAMEYCGGDSLRSLLRAPRNRCGLPARTTLDVLRDVGSAVEYLHNRRIMHRDLKPENVVLKLPPQASGQNANEFPDPDNCMPGAVYKLVDLGCAKDLKDQSMAVSFTGTFLYLAPELFLEDQPYSYPAEYWSLGTLIFECIAGKRPFFLNTQKVLPIKWHANLQQKQEHEIYGTVESLGSQVNVQYFSTLPPSCDMHLPHRHAMEAWLRSVLDVDPSKRGGYTQYKRDRAGRPKCFALLDAVLSIQAVHVFYVCAYTTFSYALNDLDNSVRQLQERLAEDTGIAIDNQILLSGTGQNVAEHDALSRSVQDMAADRRWLFLLPPASNFTLLKPKTAVYGFVLVVLQDPTALLSREKRQLAFEESIHLAHQMFAVSQRLMQAQKASLLGVMRASLRLEQKTKRALADGRKLISFSLFIQRDAVDHLALLTDCVKNTLLAQVRPAIIQYDQDLNEQCEILSSWQNEDLHLEEHEQYLADVKKQVAVLQRHPSVVLPQCDEGLARHVNEAEDLLRSIRSENDEEAGGAADTQAMNRTLTACSEDLRRISRSMCRHWQDMLVSYGLCVDRLNVIQRLATHLSARLRLLEDMRGRQLTVWSFVASAATATGHDGDRRTGAASHVQGRSWSNSGSRSDHGHHGYHGARLDHSVEIDGQLSRTPGGVADSMFGSQSLQPRSSTGTGTVTGGGGQDHNVVRRGSGTVRQLSAFLDGRLAEPSLRSESVLEDSLALFSHAAVSSPGNIGPQGQTQH